MVRTHENPGMPETPEHNNSTRNSSASPEWRPSHQVGNGSASEKSNLGDELDIRIWGEFPPEPKSPGEGPNSFTTETTGYWPVSKEQATAEKWEAVAEMEGWDKDMKWNLIYPMHTIDAVEAKMKVGQLWPEDYVAVAMDSGIYPYGTKLTSPDYPGIPFCLVDTGGAFQWAWTKKLDIATSEHDRMTQLSASGVRFDRVGGGLGMN